MKRFVKVALLLAAFSVLACGAAFAAPLAPGDLVVNHDVRLIQTSGDYGTIVAPDPTAPELNIITADGRPYLNFDVTVSGDELLLDTETVPSARFLGVAPISDDIDFHAILVRGTFDSKLRMQFDVPGTLSVDQFGLRGGFETTVTPTSTDQLASDCTLGCDNFYFALQHSPITAAGKRYDADLAWTNTNVYDVVCCENFGLAAAPALGVSADAFTGGRDFVVAHLSETPFVRVRVGQQVEREVATNVLSDDLFLRALDAENRARNISGVVLTDDHYFDRLVDVPEGETYNMGVYYVDSTDCALYCAEVYCDHYQLPFVSVTNLGTKAVDIHHNYVDAADGTKFDIKPWLCNSWCGLCEIDDMMSGDKGSLGYGIASAATVQAQSALFGCICDIYPAFTNTFKAAGNVGIDWTAKVKADSTLAAGVKGRVHVSWQKVAVESAAPGEPICPSCPVSEQYEYPFWYPCNCLLIDYEDYEPLFAGARFVVSGDVEPVEVSADEDVYASNGVAFKLTPAGVGKDFTLTRLSWTLDAADLAAAGLTNVDWWRGELWNKMDITINGKKLIGDGVMTAEQLEYMTVVDGPQGKLSDLDDIRVDLYVFVTTKEVANGVKYNDHALHGPMIIAEDKAGDAAEFTLVGSVVAAGAGPVPTELTVTPTELKLYLDSTITGTLKAENATGTVRWTVDQAEEFVSISPDQGAEVTVTALKVTAGNVKVIATDDAASADCIVTVDAKKPVSPDQPGDGGSGGCSVGFAPAALLLLAPLFFLKK